MTLPDNGVDLLLRRATDDLRPDVDHLVAGGITRGRSRQRRARIGTAVAAVAVLGVFGATAAVVPQLGLSGARSADTGLAGESPAPSPQTVEVPLPARTPVDAALAVPAADIPAAVDELLGTSVASVPLQEAPYGVKDEPRDKTVHFRFNGMLTSVVIEVWPRPEETCQGSNTCETRPDGSLQNSWEGTGDGVTSRGVTVYRHGYAISVLSYNAADGKESPILAPAPPMTIDQLLAVAGSDVWFG